MPAFLTIIFMQQHSHPWKHYDKAIHQALVREIRKRLVAFTYSNDPINQSRLIQLLRYLPTLWTVILCYWVISGDSAEYAMTTD